MTDLLLYFALCFLASFVVVFGLMRMGRQKPEEKRELNFYQLPTAENHPVIFKAHGLVYEYYVREVEVNVPLMREVEKSEKPSLDSDLAERVKALEAKLEAMNGDGK